MVAISQLRRFFTRVRNRVHDPESGLALICYGDLVEVRDGAMQHASDLHFVRNPSAARNSRGNVRRGHSRGTAVGAVLAHLDARVDLQQLGPSARTLAVQVAGDGVGREVRSILLLPLGDGRRFLLFGSTVDEFPEAATQELTRLRDGELSKTAVAKAELPGPLLVGSSALMEKVRKQLRALAPGKATVLIEGESGTGKEVAARLIHHLSARSQRSFLGVNLGAVAETLLDSELFGHRRGSFTGAVADREGLFEKSSGGTLLLDEIGEASADLQVRLLRAIQEGEIRRVGDDAVRRVDPRLIAATNRHLEGMVRRGQFREDLYYRIRVGYVKMPALREHLEDFGELFDHVLSRLIEGHPALFGELPESACDPLLAHDWPGNVRELENVIQRMVALRGVAGGFLEPAHVQSFVREEWRSSYEETRTVAVQAAGLPRAPTRAGGGAAAPAAAPAHPPVRSTVTALDELRRETYRVCESKVGARLGRAFCSHWFLRTSIAAQQHVVPLDGPLIPRGTTERHISPNNAVCRKTLASPMINASFCSVDDTEQFRQTMSRSMASWQDLRPYRCITADFWCVWCPLEPFGLERFGALSFGEVLADSSRFEEKMESLMHRAQRERGWQFDLTREQMEHTRRNLRQISRHEEEEILRAIWSASKAFAGALEEVTRRGLGALEEQVERLAWTIDRLVVPWAGPEGSGRS